MTPPQGNSKAAKSQPRDLSLEALRGIAALIVMAWHFMMAFYWKTVFEPSYGFLGSPFYFLIHGPSVVSIFFVLSGYVLTKKYFETNEGRILSSGALKRYFRLLPIPFISIMASWALFHFGLYSYKPAGDITGSPWLANFANGISPSFSPTFGAAFLQGSYITFFTGDSSFNPLLWTIHVELIGSFIAFGLAGIIAGVHGRVIAVVIAALTAAIVAHYFNFWFVPFIPGVLLAYYANNLKGMKLITAFILIVLGLLIIGFREPIGFYSFMKFIGDYNGDMFRTYFATFGSCLIMASIIGCEKLKQSMQGKISHWLGRLSFPFYAVHILILCSLASWVFVHYHATKGYDMAAAFAAVTLFVPSVILAALLAEVDERWAKYLNGWFRWLTGETKPKR